jgi:hypothetical protein
MSDATPPARAAKPDNPLANLLLNVLLPVTVLSTCGGKPGPTAPFYAIGPKWALVVAVLLPLGYFVWDYQQRRKVNAFSIIGLVSVLLTGGLGLLNLTAQSFAIKEASMPLILAGIIWWTGRGPKPLVRQLLLNPDMVDVKKVEAAIDAHSARSAFNRLIRSSTFLLMASMLLSAVLNYFLALFFLKGLQPDTPEYTGALAKLTGWGWVVIGVPTAAMTIWAMIRLMKGVRQLTGLTSDEIFLPR